MKVTADDLNLRHLRAFVEICRLGSISAAAGIVHLSQPAITQGLRNLETKLRTKLFQRGARGMVPTDLGRRLEFRVTRAFGQLNAGLPKTKQQPAERLAARITSAQLRTLVAVGKTRSYSDAARLLDVAQPSIHRAARDLESGLGLALFDKTPSGINLTRQGLALFRATRLMQAELGQALQEISTALGQDVAEIRLGALPLARATIIAPAIEHMAQNGHRMRVHVDDGPYADLLQAVRSGELDILVGALRSPAPGKDVTQIPLFSDRLGVFCGPAHPLLGVSPITMAQMSVFPWVLPRPDTPTRNFFDAAFPKIAQAVEADLVETSSMILVRDLLQSSHRLTLISRAQVVSEIKQGLMCELPINLDDPPRPIGILQRTDWYPTAEQELFLAALRKSAAGMAP